MSDTIFRIVIGEDPPPRLDKALAEAAPEGAGLSRSRLGKLIEAGSVRVSCGLEHPDDVVADVLAALAAVAG